MSFNYAGVTYPLSATSSKTLLADADPALYLALDFFTFVIRQYVGARLFAEAAVCGAPITNAVSCALPYEPGPWLMMEKMALPALFVFRHTAKNDYKTLVRSHETGILECNYVLPALTPAQAEHILPIRHAIRLLLAQRLEQGWDAAYTPPGGALGGQVWALAGLDEISLTDATYAGFTGVGDLYLPALAMTLEVQERNEGDVGVPLTGVRAAVAVRNADGTTTTPVADTDVTPP